MIAPGIGIRLANETDLTGVVALERTVTEAPHWPEKEYIAIFDQGQGVGNLIKRCLLIAEAKGRLLGFGVGKMIESGEGIAELESIVVDKNARRRGVGKALCEAVAAWSRQQGASGLELEVRAGNEAAIALYTSLGFDITGRRRAYYAQPVEDALLMRLNLEKGF
jgi:[ribosomal protein S18]-alanine N-acetyltransferase